MLVVYTGDSDGRERSAAAEAVVIPSLSGHRPGGRAEGCLAAREKGRFTLVFFATKEEEDGGDIAHWPRGRTKQRGIFTKLVSKPLRSRRGREGKRGL